MFRRILAAVLVLGLGVSAMTACSGGRETAVPGKMAVSVTFDAVKEIAAAVGGDRVTIGTIIPDGTEPHDFEPKAKDLVALTKARVFIYSGMGMETWEDSAVRSVGNSKLIVVEASKGVAPISAGEAGKYDPHVWMSLKAAETEAQNIRDAFVSADPAGRDVYTRNCAAFVAQLESLYKTYDAKFRPLKNRSFVTGHAAFAYFCRDFGLTQQSVEDVFAEGEPSPQKLAGLVKYCQANHVKTIFVEDMVSPAVSKTLADEVGAQVKTIYTMESTEGGKTYLARMQDNLNNIYQSLLS